MPNLYVTKANAHLAFVGPENMPPFRIGEHSPAQMLLAAHRCKDRGLTSILFNDAGRPGAVFTLVPDLDEADVPRAWHACVFQIEGRETLNQPEHP